MNTDQSLIYLKIPAESWSLLEETLQVDARSNNFDKELRADIEMALDEVEELQVSGTTPNLVAAVDFAINQIEHWNQENGSSGYIGAAFEALVNALAKNGMVPTGKANLFRHHANGVMATERVLFTLQKYWNVRVLMQSDDLVLVQHPFTTDRDHRLSYKLFLLSDNGGEVNVELINDSHQCDSVPSSSSEYVLTAETMAWRIWRTMDLQDVDWENNNPVPPAPPYTEPLKLGYYFPDGQVKHESAA